MKYFLVTAYNLFPEQCGERRATHQFIVGVDENNCVSAEKQAIEDAYVHHHGVGYCANEMQRNKFRDAEDYRAWMRNHPDWESGEIEDADAHKLITARLHKRNKIIILL
jgi:hypothetical protein